MDRRCVQPRLTVSHPNILIISEVPMGAPNGFGVTLKNLFTGWPRERIRYFYNRAQYRDLPKEGLDFRFAPVPSSPGRRYALPMWLGLTPEWRGNYSGIWLRRNVRGFAPDLVFSSVHSLTTISFAEWVAQQLGQPHVLHVMDEPFFQAEPALVDAMLQRVRSLFTISETMRRAYYERYGRDSQVFHNGAEPEFFHPPAPLKSDSERPVRLRFIGNLLHLQHFQSIEDIAAAVQQHNRGGGRPAVLEIYGGEHPEGCCREILADGEITYHGRIDLDERLNTIAGADLLVIPFTFDKEYFQEYRLSIPTKLPENLATGKPVLLYGPKGMAATDLCLKHDLATVLTERSVPSLVKFLREFTDNSEPYLNKAAGAQHFAKRELSAKATSLRFQNMLHRIAA